MARRPREKAKLERLSPDKLESYVAGVLRETGYHVNRTERSRDNGIDLIAEAPGLGRTRIAVEVKSWQRPVPLDEVRRLYGVMMGEPDISRSVLIGMAFTQTAIAFAEKNPRLQLITFDEFEREAAIPRRLPELRRGRTAVGRAVIANRVQIEITSAALVILLEERIATLRMERPNSDEAQALRDDRLAHYETLKRDVLALADQTTQFRKDPTKEKEVVKASKALADGIGNWWTKGHEKILQSAYDMSMFGTAVAICSMAGSGGKIAVGVSAALVGGKKLTDALKGLKGLWK